MGVELTVSPNLGIPSNPACAKSMRVRHWTKVLAAFFTYELAGRVLMMIAAVVIVRNMRKEEYAWYSLANNLQGALAYITLAGVGTGLYALGGQRIGDRFAMGQVVGAAKLLRVRTAIVTLPILLPLVTYSLIKTGCSLWASACLLISIVLLLSQQITLQFAEFPFGLIGKYNIPQLGSLLTNIARLGVVLVLVATHSLTATNGMIASIACGYLILWTYLIPRAVNYVEPRVPPTPELRASFQRHLWNGLPISVFYAAQSQFGNVILAISGTSDSIANLGALTRIGMLTAILDAAVGKILTPRLAVEGDKKKLRKACFMIVLCGFIGGASIALGVSFSESLILFLLGPNYSGMGTELRAYAALLGFTFFVTSMSAIPLARGWVRHNWVLPVMIIAFQAIAYPFCDVHRVTGIIILFAASAFAQLAMNLFLIVRGFQGKSSV